MRPLWKWLTLRVPQDFAERLDKAVESRSTGNSPLLTRAEAIREALGQWMDLHNHMICNSFEKGPHDEVQD